MVSLLASFNSQPCTAGANWPEDRRLFPHSQAARLDLESRESLTGIYPTTCFYFLSLPFRVATVLLTKDFDDTKPDDQHRHLSLRDFVSLCRAKKKKNDFVLCRQVFKSEWVESNEEGKFLFFYHLFVSRHFEASMIESEQRRNDVVNLTTRFWAPILSRKNENVRRRLDLPKLSV